MRKINKTGRSVSWGKHNYLYSYPSQGGFPRIECSAVIFYPGSCKIQESFEALNVELLYRCVDEWARQQSIIISQEAAAFSSVSGDPF